MTLLSLCTAVCNLTPIAAPATIVGNTDQTALTLLAVANQAGQSLARGPPGGWVQMIREFDFTTAAIEAQPGTVDNSSPDGNGVIANLVNTNRITPGAWVASGTGIPDNAVVTAVTTNTVTINQPATPGDGIGSFVIGVTSIGGPFNGIFNFGQSDYTLPSDFQRPIDDTFWDRSRFWSMRGPQSPQQWQLYKSSVIGRASIQRRFRFRSADAVYSGAASPNIARISIDPVPFDNGAALVFEYVSTGWCQSSGGTPQSSWQADTDVGVLDEYLLELGILYRFLRRMGLSYNEEMDEYERQVDKAMATDGGSAILNLTPSDHLSLIGPWNLPETGFGNVLNT